MTVRDSVVFIVFGAMVWGSILWDHHQHTQGTSLDELEKEIHEMNSQNPKGKRDVEEPRLKAEAVRTIKDPESQRAK